MRKLNILIVFVISAVTLLADNRISIFIRDANRYASVDVSDFRRRMCWEYNLSHRALDDCYRWCGKNWGNVGVALEIAHTSGRHIHDVCRFYKKYRRHGWNRVLVEIGIRPGSHFYKPFYDRIHYHGGCWVRFYDSYCIHHHGHYNRHSPYHSKHKYYKQKKCHRYLDDDEYDDDDYDYDD